MVAGKNQPTSPISILSRTSRWGLLLLAVLVTGIGSQSYGASLSDTLSWKDADGKAVSFQSLNDLEDFLLTADVVSVKRAPEGTTAPQKVLLEKNGIRMYACFRYVSVNQREIRLQSGALKFNFRDDAIFEIAAYRLARLMGYPNVPPTVVRRIRGRQGTLQAWVPNCMSEEERIKQNKHAKNVWRWAMQVQAMKLFDALIYNEDRHRGNILIDPDWDIWLIDHTRTFRTYDEPADLDQVQAVEKGVWQQLNTVSDQEITDTLAPYLGEGQIKTLLKRRARIVEHLAQLIQEKGESRVLYSIWPDRTTPTAITVVANPN
jgi:hypothetical protein